MTKILAYIVSISLCFGTFAFANNVNFCNELSWNSAKEECFYKISGVSFRIFHNGIVKVDTNDKGEHEFQIILPEHFFIESAKYFVVDKSIVFAFGITGADAGSSIVALYDTEGMNLKWQTEIRSFNISEPLIANNAIYIGAFGTIAKIDIRNGVQVWIHKKLYEQDISAFNSFEKPIITGSCVKFIEAKTAAAKYPGVREVIVDDLTGKIKTTKDCTTSQLRGRDEPRRP